MHRSAPLAFLCSSLTRSSNERRQTRQRIRSLKEHMLDIFVSDNGIKSDAGAILTYLKEFSGRSPTIWADFQRGM